MTGSTVYDVWKMYEDGYRMDASSHIVPKEEEPQQSLAEFMNLMGITAVGVTDWAELKRWHEQWRYQNTWAMHMSKIGATFTGPTELPVIPDPNAITSTGSEVCSPIV
jgi:hypothetical protein